MTFNNSMLKTRQGQWDMVTPASKRADKSKMLVQSADKLFTSSPSLLRDRPFYRGRTQQFTDLKLTLAYKITSCSPATQLKFPDLDNTRCLYQRNAIIFVGKAECLYNQNPFFQLLHHTQFCIKMIPFNNWCPMPFITLFCVGQQCAEKHWDPILIHFTGIQMKNSEMQSTSKQPFTKQPRQSECHFRLELSLKCPLSPICLCKTAYKSDERLM